ncbi:TIGR02444 family protein [Legionella jordanis]|nr:TIGR02444 family protein [Legionella jordanis]
MNNPFWQFSLRVYHCRQVRESCLNLQDQFHVNVNLLLLCLWLSMYVEPIEQEEFLSACHAIKNWQDYLTIPLRKLRQFLKTEISNDWLKNFYHQLLQDELISEAYQQHQLFLHFKDKQRSKPEENKQLAFCYLQWLFTDSQLDADESTLINFINILCAAFEDES